MSRYDKDIAMPHKAKHAPSGLKSTEFKDPEGAFAELLPLASSYMSDEEVDTIKRAYEFASKAHAGQLRKSGEPFIVHPIEVAIILTDLRMDMQTVCAAILHDTVEDTDVTPETIS